MNIFDLIAAKPIATYYTNSPSNKIPMLGELLFPATKQTGLDLSWIKGYNGLPVSLAPAAFDAKAPMRDRIGVTRIETEMPFFREAMRIGEKERQELLKVSGGMNQSLVEPVIKRIYDDVSNLVDGAGVVAERMRMQLLSNGAINIVGVDGQGYTVDYRLPKQHRMKLTKTNTWSNPKAPVVTQIRSWQDTVENDTGNRPHRAICTRKTWDYLMQNETIRLDMNPLGGQNIIMTDSLLKQYFSAKLGLQVSIYNKKFSEKLGGPAFNYFPDDVFTLIPDGNLGKTYYGTTPEEADSTALEKVADVQIVNTGVAVTTIMEAHPVNKQVIVSEIVLPSFEAIDSVFIATVA